MEEQLTKAPRVARSVDTPWPKTRLDGITKVEWGNTSITKASYVEQGFTAFSASGPDGYLPKAEWHGPAVVLSAIGARCGKCFLAGGGWTAIKNTIVIQGDAKRIDHTFLFYFLNDPTQWAISGSGQPFITLKTSRAVEVPLPPLLEQRRIVEAIELQLGRLDAAVARLHAAKAKLKRYKQAVLKAAVEGALTEEWREKNPGVESAELIVERIQERRATTEKTGRKTKTSTPAELDLDSLPLLPEGWIWSTLPQLGELNRGKSKHRPRDDKRLFGGPYPFVQTGEVRYANGRLTKYTTTYSEFGLSQSRLWPAGTLCITIAANIADTAVLEFDGCFPDSVVGFIPEEDSIDVHFAELFIRTVKQDIERYAPATAQKNINLEVLRDVAIALPPRAEQQELMRIAGDVLSTIDEMESTLDAQLSHSTRLRQAVLKRAFEGRLV